MRHVGALYGTQLDLEGIKPKRATKVKGGLLCPTEQQEQFVVHAWLVRRGIIHNHSPNGGYRDLIEAAKFKRMGVSPGFPDFEIPYPRKGHHGLYIELKRMMGGKLSEFQMQWRDFLVGQGYAWFEAKGADECIKIISDYLDII
jgi:hypothetical protein